MSGATSTDAIAGGNFTQSYVYDAIGNLTRRSDVGAYGYDHTGYANPHAATSVGGVAYGYDNNGNLTSSGPSTYAWDFKNRLLTSVVNGATSTYAYDHAGNRSSQTTSASSTTYASDAYSVSSGIPTKHLFAGGLLVATIEGSTSTAVVHFIHTDHLTGSSVVSSATGTIVELLDYYPYGGIRLDEQAAGYSEARKFAGHEYDGATGLSYQKARYYDPSIGRFLSQDPAFLAIGDSGFSKKYERTLESHLENPQNLNSYAYVNNNPLKYTDPSGEILPVIVGALSVYGWVSAAISAYDFNTVVIDHPEVFSEKEINQAGTGLLVNVVTAGMGQAASGIGATISTSADDISKLFFGSFGVFVDSVQNLLPEKAETRVNGSTNNSSRPTATPSSERRLESPTIFRPSTNAMSQNNATPGQSTNQPQPAANSTNLQNILRSTKRPQ